MNDLQQAPYNVEDIGDGIKFDYDTLSVEYVAKKRKILSDAGFKFPDNDLFNKRVLEFFKTDLKNYKNKVVVLRNSKFPEIAIKDERFIVFDDPDNEFESQELYHYNSFVFYHNKASLSWLKAKGKFLLEDLVVAYGYTGNDDLNGMVFKNYDYLSPSAFKQLIFDSGKKLKIRENALKQIIKYSYNGPSEDLSYAKEGNGFMESSSVIEDIDKNSDKYDNPIKTKAVLFENQLQVGIVGFLESYLQNNPEYKSKFKNEKYYNLERLENYIENIYQDSGEDQNDKTFVIKDADGYTNLRSGKGTSFDVVEKINSGSGVTILDHNGDWWQVLTKSGKKGYVHKSKIQEE